MASGTKGTGSKVVVWTLLTLLIVGLAGFGATNFGGTISTIGQVGDRDIDVQRYINELRGELNAFSAQTGQNITFAQAQEFGLDQRALQRLVTTVAIENEAGTLGLSAGDEQIRTQILSIQAFQGLNGQFDRESYRFALQQSGQNEAAFEEDLRAEISRSLLQGAVVGGTSAPEIFSEVVFNYIAERRDFTWVNLGLSDLETPIAAPTDADLQAFFDDNNEDFMLPETRQITYVWLTPDMLVDTVTIDDEALQALYDDRFEEFNKPERRLVERLTLGNDAEAAKARLDAGEVTFEELVAERGLNLADIDLGDVTEYDLDDGADEVFALSEAGIVGPIETELGGAIFRVNAILAELETTFEDARPALAEEFALDRARRIIGDEQENIEDLLAGGATLEELADETDMQLRRIDWSIASTDEIAGYAAFRDAAGTTEVGDFAETIELEDGGIFALRLDELIEPRLESFQSAKGRAEAGWRLAETSKALAAQAQSLADQMAAGADFESLGLTPLEQLDATRTSFVPDAPESILETVFDMAPGDIRVVGGGNSAALVRLDTIAGPDPEDTEMATSRDRMEESVAQSVASDILAAYATAILAEAGVSLNQTAINAVHTQFP